MDFTKLAKYAEFSMTPEQRANIADWHAGSAAGLTGSADDDTKSPSWRQAWTIASVKRRVIAGEVIAVMMGGTHCKACGSVNYGYRMGCRCNGEIEWGALILSANDGECAPFKRWDELRASKAAGVPVLDSDTGADFCLDEKDGES